jgi:enoyl-CoA hydratase/carnithine racemase
MADNISNEFYHAYMHGHLAVLHFRAGVFDLLTDVDRSEEMMTFIRETEHDRAVRGLLLLHEPGILGEEAYDAFIKSILHEGQMPDDMESPDFTQRLKRFRQIIILRKFIRFLSNYFKPTFSGLNSTLVTPFVGVALSTDFRLASPKAVFSFAHRKYGLHPSGALPYSLAHYAGHSRAMDIQFSDRLDAEQAFRLGLVSQILPQDNFEDNCIRYTQRYLHNCPSTIKLTKRLNNFDTPALDDYLDYEASLLNL